MLSKLVLIFASGIPSQSGPVPSTWFNAFVTAIDPRESYFEPADLISQPNRQQVASVLPLGATVSFWITALCSVREDGTLRQCKPQRLWPDNPETFVSASKLFPLFRISRDDAASVTTHKAEVLLDLYLDDDSRKLDRSCPPGWCPVTPAPPPPPPRP